MTQYIKHSFGVYRQGVTNGSPIVLDGPTDISLNIDQQSILKISRVGDDLVVYLVDGQQVVLEGFFLSTTGFQENRLFTSVDGEIQEVELGERYGLFNTAEYNPLDVYDDGLLFDGSGEQSLLFETKTAAVGGAGNLGVIAGGVAGIGLLGALAGGGGSGSQATSVADTVDGIAPTAPVIQVANGSQISGTGEPGAIIDLDTNGDGVVDLSTTVAANGTWSVTPNPALANGTPITVRQTDPDGNQSLAAADTVDGIAPTAPVIQIANASQISGTGEPGAIIDLDTNGDGVVDLSTTVAANGTWSVTPNPALANGTPITVRQTDPDGNQSLAAADTVDGIAPTAPVIQIANASQISGTGEPGARIGVDVNGDGVADLTTTVAGNGSWSVTPNPVLADGTLVTARQTDPDGNQSLTTADTVDAIAPTAPYVDVSSDGTQIIGTAEPNSEVSVSYVGSGSQIITLNPITVSGTGSWSTLPNPTLVANEDIYVQAEDVDGNESAYTLVLQGTDDGIISFSSLSGDIAVGVAAFDIESIDLSDDTSNALIISESNLQSLSVGSDDLRVDGVVGNGVTASGASANGSTTINGEIYNIYEFAGGGQIAIDQDISVVV